MKRNLYNYVSWKRHEFNTQNNTQINLKKYGVFRYIYFMRNARKMVICPVGKIQAASLI